MNITTHTIVANEDQWIWFSLMSVRDLVSEMLIIDDASTDKTVEIIKSIKDPKINLFERKLTTPADHTKARNELITKTRTDWFLILDGDEVWGQKTLQAFLKFLDGQPENIYGVAMRTRNCIGDVYHYLPEEAGKYRLLGRSGHLTIRAYRNIPGFHWEGNYPLETFVDNEGISINSQDSHLNFFDGFYWHMTHLQRSSKTDKVKGWRTKKTELGISVIGDFPEVFYLDRPIIVPSPWKKMTLSEKVYAGFLTPVKKIKRKLSR